MVAQQKFRDLERILSRFADKWNRGFNRWIETPLLIKEAILNRVSQQPAVLIPYERCAMLRKEGFVSHRLRYDRRLARYKTVPASDGSLTWPSLTISRICNSDVVDCLRAAKVNSFRLATRSAVSMPNTRSSFAL